VGIWREWNWFRTVISVLSVLSYQTVKLNLESTVVTGPATICFNIKNLCSFPAKVFAFHVILRIKQPLFF
jgi:hypothetical protein